MLSRKLATSVMLLSTVTSFTHAPWTWAQLHHEHAHQPPEGAAHDHRFDNVEQAVEMFESTERDSWQKPDEVMTRLQLRAGDVVVDIGAGTGYFTRRFAAAVGPQGSAVGLDVEPTMAAHINAEAAKLGLANLTARQVPADDPQLEPQSVDVVFICDTYHHMQGRVAYARRLAEALKPGGRVVIIDFHKRELPLGPPVEWKLTAEAVTAEFQQAGFELSRSIDFLPYQYFLEFTLATKGDERKAEALVPHTRG
ncbi:MAG: methyltransferase domain-containing protein [Gammaproteobacteria bacterium]